MLLRDLYDFFLIDFIYWLLRNKKVLLYLVALWCSYKERLGWCIRSIMFVCLFSKQRDR